MNRVVIEFTLGLGHVRLEMRCPGDTPEEAAAAALRAVAGWSEARDARVVKVAAG